MELMHSKVIALSFEKIFKRSAEINLIYLQANQEVHWPTTICKTICKRVYLQTKRLLSGEKLRATQKTIRLMISS